MTNITLDKKMELILTKKFITNEVKIFNPFGVVIPHCKQPRVTPVAILIEPFQGFHSVFANVLHLQITMS